MNSEIAKYFLPVSAFLIVLLIKQLLDLRMMPTLVKYLHWIPIRNYFRDKPISISGDWEQVWDDANSVTFENPTGRHSHPVVKQWGHYCYAETIANQKTYVVFGDIRGDYWIGDWYDQKNPKTGYFGTFQLRIKDAETMEGKWMGHSKNEVSIRCDDWVWKKL